MVEKETTEVSQKHKVFGFIITMILLPILFMGTCVPIGWGLMMAQRGLLKDQISRISTVQTSQTMKAPTIQTMKTPTSRLMEDQTSRLPADTDPDPTLFFFTIYGIIFFGSAILLARKTKNPGIRMGIKIMGAVLAIAWILASAIFVR